MVWLQGVQLLHGVQESGQRWLTRPLPLFCDWKWLVCQILMFLRSFSDSDLSHPPPLPSSLCLSLYLSLSLSLFLSLPRGSSRLAKWGQVCRSQSRASSAASYPAINSTIKTQPCQIHPARSLLTCPFSPCSSSCSALVPVSSASLPGSAPPPPPQSISWLPATRPPLPWLSQPPALTYAKSQCLQINHYPRPVSLVSVVSVLHLGSPVQPSWQDQTQTFVKFLVKIICRCHFEICRRKSGARPRNLITVNIQSQVCFLLSQLKSRYRSSLVTSDTNLNYPQVFKTRSGSC